MTLLVASLKLGADLYLWWRLRSALGYVAPASSGRLEWAVTVIFLSFYLLPLTGLIQFLFGTGVHILEYPKLMLYLFWGGLAFSFQLITWVILYDLAYLFMKGMSGIEPGRYKKWFGYLLLGTSLFVLAYSGIKMYRDSTQITVEKTELRLKGLPEVLEGLKIVHISDIQADRFTTRSKVARYIERINAQNADLILFTGDLISYGTRYVDMAAHQLANAESRYGTYAVIGDHDYWAGAGEIAKALEEHDIPMLDDKNVFIGIDTASVKLTGITEVYSKSAVPSDVKKLLSEEGGSRAAVKILASHQVSGLLQQEAQREGYDLMLAGHTHGGQVRLPLFWFRVAASQFETDFVRGLYRTGELTINVNSGLGYTLAPVRYNAPAAVSVIELTGD